MRRFTPAPAEAVVLFFFSPVSFPLAAINWKCVF